MTMRKIIFPLLALLTVLTAIAATSAASAGGDGRAAGPHSPVTQPAATGPALPDTTTSSTLAPAPTAPELAAPDAEEDPTTSTHDSFEVPAPAPHGDDVPQAPTDDRRDASTSAPIVIAHLGDDRPVPAAFASIVVPQAGGPVGAGAADGYAAAPSCAHRCITKGVAYAHGSDVELVIETSVPVQLYISVVADLDHDGLEELVAVDSTAFGYTSYSFVIEDVVPGETYYVMVGATDSNLYTDYAWGEFTLP